jgi:uncharacterized protein (TIGR02270 family)
MVAADLVAATLPPPRGFLRDVLDEHAEVAGLMIRMRAGLVDALHVDLAGLVRLDDRLDAHLDGLRAAGEEGYVAACEALRAGREGSLFAVAVLAMERGHDQHSAEVSAVAEATPNGQRELRAAVEWISPRRIGPWADALLSRAAPAHRVLALLARHAHRMPVEPASEIVRQMSSDAAPGRRALAYQVLGDTAGEVETSSIEPGTRDPHPEVRLAALWAQARKAQSPPSPEALVAVALEAPHLAERAFEIAARCAPPGAAPSLLTSLPPGEAGERAGIRAVVAAARPEMVPWLLPRLRAPATARLAAWAYAMVTGCVIGGDRLADELVCRGPAPPGAGPNDDPADNRTAMLPEHRAPWPEADRVEEHWERWRAAANRETRYLLGQPITRERLVDALAQGAQPRRTLAALELALLDRREPLFCTRAPGFRQRMRLGR